MQRCTAQFSHGWHKKCFFYAVRTSLTQSHSTYIPNTRTEKLTPWHAGRSAPHTSTPERAEVVMQPEGWHLPEVARASEYMEDRRYSCL